MLVQVTSLLCEGGDIISPLSVAMYYEQILADVNLANLANLANL